MHGMVGHWAFYDCGKTGDLCLHWELISGNFNTSAIEWPFALSSNMMHRLMLKTKVKIDFKT